MKKLMWMVVFALACVACSKDDDYLSVGELVGKWSIYEFEENGETEPADLDTELSYWEFKSGGGCEEYDYYMNRTSKGTYSLEGDVITVTYGKEASFVKVIEMHKDRAVVEMEEEGETYIARLQRTDNEPMLYLEPVLDFGASASQIKAKERRDFKRESGGTLLYEGSNYAEDYMGYMFENGKLESAAVNLKLSTPVEDVESFLSGKYKKIGESEGIFYWGNDKVMLGLAVKTSGYMIIYMAKE